MASRLVFIVVAVQVLIFGGRILSNPERLVDAGLNEDKITLHMMVRPKTDTSKGEADMRSGIGASVFHHHFPKFGLDFSSH
jgi:hypothetical protein